MSTYIIGDIHGCYDELRRMIKIIEPSAEDRLILIGDYIDRGRQNYEMLAFIDSKPDNISLIRGNHEEEFISYVNLMLVADRANHLETDFASAKETKALYDTVRYGMRKNGNHEAARYFDAYGTIHELIQGCSVTMEHLIKWAARMREMPYYIRSECSGKSFVAVHAGYREDLPADDLPEFYLYAREESVKSGGLSGGIVISGHTPTILRNEYAYASGNVFRVEDSDKKCVFYDIDCGCVFRSKYPSARLACIRIEDEKIFYV